MNSYIQILLISAIICTSLVSSAVVQRDASSFRVKRQWGWGEEGGREFGRRNDFRERNRMSDCQTSGINIVGLPISSFNCRDSAQSSRMSQRQGGFQGGNMMQGPIGGLLGGLMGR